MKVKIRTQKNPYRLTIPVHVCRAMGLRDGEQVDLFFEDMNGNKAVAGSEVTTSGCEVIVKDRAARPLMTPKCGLYMRVRRA